MFYSTLEPEFEDDFVEESVDEITEEFVEKECSKETFASIGRFVPVVIENAAIASSIAPDTESPIEVLFGAEAVKFFQELYKTHPTMKFVRCCQPDENTFAGDHTLLMSQYRFGNYRIDWMLKVTFLNQPYFAIECDGRDFHSSEQQVLRDRAKDAAIKSAGMQIFRFSGSELDRNSLACVKAVHSATKAQYIREYAAGFHRKAG